jgi:hypothetical protein
LEGSTLRGAILVGANLDGANLRGATLLEVRIEPETLTERELHLDPVLEELNELQLSAIRQPATLSGVQFNGATQWPTTFRPAVAVAAQVAQTTTTPLTNPLTTILPATTFAEVTGEGTTARRVKVNFFIDAIRAIDSVTGAYDIDCTLDFHWFDPTLVDQDVEQVEPARLWQPYLDLVNAEAFTIVSQHYQNSLEPGANVRLTYHVVGRFFTPFDLHKFPFDQQTFSIQLESADDDSEQVIFDFVYLLEPVAPSEEAYRQEVPRGRYIAANAAPADWQVAQVAIGQVVRVLPHDKSSWSQFRIDILMTRQALYYFWRTLLVLALIMFLVWGALLVDGEALAMRLWLLFLLCVMTVAVNALMTRSLPSSNVLTFLDLYRLICYGLILLMALAVVAVKLLYREPWRDWGVRLNRLLVIGYPLAVILVNVALYWYALG